MAHVEVYSEVKMHPLTQAKSKLTVIFALKKVDYIAIGVVLCICPFITNPQENHWIHRHGTIFFVQ